MSNCIECDDGKSTEGKSGYAQCVVKVGRLAINVPQNTNIAVVDDYTVQLSWTWNGNDADLRGFQVRQGTGRQFVGAIVSDVPGGGGARSIQMRLDEDGGRNGNKSNDNLNVPLWQRPSPTYLQVRAVVDASYQSLWSLATEPWTPAFECGDTSFLNVTSRDLLAWSCAKCPIGASCLGSVVWHDVKAVQGWWRVPWSEHNDTFEVCPYVDDCLGFSHDLHGKNNNLKSGGRQNLTAVTEGCRKGTEGPLCSICEPGHNRDVLTCVKCRDESFPIRVALFVLGLGLLFGMASLCRRSLAKRWKQIKPFWIDLLRILNLMVTFAQINSSLPSVIEIQWPPNFVAFVAALNFVNIDVLSLIGASCVGNFDFRISFAIMMLLPLSILGLAVAEFKCSRRSDRIKMSKMNEAEKKVHYAEALLVLFQLADNDNSGRVDPMELSAILKQLGWPTKVEASREIMESTVGVQMDKNGMFHLLPEDAFVHAMVSGRMIDALTQKNVARRRTRTVLVKKKSLVNLLGAAEMVHEKRATLDTEDRLVAWTVRRQHAATALSGAVQLLLLAHTPVSRKVFQWFHCNDIAGRVFLRADVSSGCPPYGSPVLFVLVFTHPHPTFLFVTPLSAVPHCLPKRRLACIFANRLSRAARVHRRAPALHHRVLVRPPGRAVFDGRISARGIFI
jgi:hypothetical protein